MDSAVLTTVLVISLATNAVVLGLLLAGRLGFVRRASYPAAAPRSRTQASLMPVMASPDDAHPGQPWIQPADALAVNHGPAAGR